MREFMTISEVHSTSACFEVVANASIVSGLRANGLSLREER